MIGVGLNITRPLYGTATALSSDPIVALNPTIWLRRDSVAASVDDPVALWSDVSGNGNHFTQPSGPKQPFMSSEGPEFDGVDDFMVSGALLLPSITIVTAVTLWAAGDYPMLVVTNPGNVELRLDGISRVPQWVVGSGGTNGSGALPLGTPIILSARYNADSGACALWRSGVLLSSGTSTYTPTASPVYLGSRDGTGFFLSATQSEVIIFDRAVTDSEMAAAVQSVAARNNITL